MAEDQDLHTSTIIKLPTPETFPAFPYNPPYSIQLDLMKHLYNAIEGRKVAVLESPTGTGKTLSLLCGSMSWLKDDQQRAKRVQLAKIEQALPPNPLEPAWVRKQYLESQRQEIEAQEVALNERLERSRRKEEAMRLKAEERMRKRPKLSHSPSFIDENDDDFLPEEIGEEEESDRHLSADVRALLKRYNQSLNPSHTVTEEEEPTCTKIFYASRTHTQLAQTVSELQKTSFPEASRVVSLGSRKNMCIHDELKGKTGDLDEACRELLTGKGDRRCPFMPSPGEEVKLLDFRDHVLATPRDIEDLVSLGRELHTCPYYGSRKAIAQAELVTLPYNLLLQKSAREALGIDLTDHVVVVDEAHNLIDTVLGVHTVPLSSATLHAAFAQLKIYLNKFRNRLSPKNALHLKRLVLVLTAIDGFCSTWKQDDKRQSNKDEMFQIGPFVDALGPKIQDINLLDVDKYIRESRIARKISGYCEKVAERERAKDMKQKNLLHRVRATPHLHAVEAFLLALTNPSEDGRIFISLLDKAPEGDSGAHRAVMLKYQLLNPAEHFKEVVSKARSVVLAGGTMQPVSDLETQLFPYLGDEDIEMFSCGHVIPKESLKCLVVEKGPRGGAMKFTFDQRGDGAMLAELGQLLTNLINVIPHGVVVFLPSYSFLNLLKQRWQADGFMEKFGVKKKVFFEPPESGAVEAVLQAYSDAVCAHSDVKRTGALLFAVVGAKLSEGLNFTDELARAVILVGLPFPNLGSADLKERMKYVTGLQKTSKKKSPDGKDAGQELYENICMKAVNQSIGRAIRHRGDWAALILVDSRYSSHRIQAKLPLWIGEQVTVANTFGMAMKELGTFYREKRVIS